MKREKDTSGLQLPLMTRHAGERMRQRGKRIGDLRMLLEFGTDVGDGYVVKHCDVERAARDTASVVARLERLVGWKLVVVSGRVVTVKPDRAHRRRRRSARSARRRFEAA